MKIFLDDVRDPPEPDWVVCRDPWSFMQTLIRGWNMIEHISFDHDLGNETAYFGEVTGYHCLSMVEDMQQCFGLKVNFTMSVHSSNPWGQERMSKLIKKIREYEE